MLRNMRLHRFAGYNASSLQKDLLAGLTVGIIAIPLGLSFAIASGVQPVYGIYTTIIAGIIMSLLGGSRFQIGGPTGAFVPVLLGIVLTEGYQSLLICGFMAGIMLVLMGVFRLGKLVRFMPRPVTLGFTAGIAIIIFTGQIARFLGLENVESHEAFIDNMHEIVLRLPSWNMYSIITAIISLAALLIIPRWSKKVPAAIVGMLIASAAALLLYPGKTATIGSTFGELPSTLPLLQFPTITPQLIIHLLPMAFVVALLGAIESLLSAVVADQMAGTKHDSDRELIGLGIANMIVPLFGGIPATGAIARTATNIRSGAASPLSGVIHGLVVLSVLLLFASYASYIPLASMAPILMLVAFNMSERKEFARLLRLRTADSLVLLVTFLLTVFMSLTTAVGAGLVLAALLFIKRMSDLSTVTEVVPNVQDAKRRVRALRLLGSPDREEQRVAAASSCPQLHLFTIEGSLFFGASHLPDQLLSEALKDRPSVVILRMRSVLYLDTTGEDSLRVMLGKLRASGISLYVSGLATQPHAVLERSGLLAEIGELSLFSRTGDAITFALSHGIDHDRCKGCPLRIFHECTELSQLGKQPPLRVRRVANEHTIAEF